MSLEENETLIRKTNEALNKKNLTALNEFMASDYSYHTNPLRGREDVKQFYIRIFKDFPEWHRTIEDIIAEGDKVWVRFRATATHTGEYRGYFPLMGKKIIFAPTGKKITPTGFVAYRIVDSKIVEDCEVSNLLDT